MPKVGYISASMAGAVMSRGKGKDAEYGATFDSLARQVAASRIGYDTDVDISGLPAVEWGIANEWEAIQLYQELTFSEVSASEFHDHPDMHYVGCTPDGLVGEDGMIEVKCPLSKNHLDNLLCNAQLAQYTPQIQFSLWVLRRNWCDWVSFDPRAPEPLRLHKVRVVRNEEYIDQLETRTAHCLDRVAAYEAVLLTRMEAK